MRYKSGRAAAGALLAVVAVMMGLSMGARASVSGANAGGLTAGAPQLFPGSAHVTSIACVDSDTCYAIGRDHPNAGPGELFTITDGTISNEQTLTGAAFMTDLACSPGGNCYAIGRASLNSKPALVLSISNGVPGAVQAAAGVGALGGLACNAEGACYAVGYGNPGTAGVIVPIDDGQIGPAVPVPGTESLVDIDCPTADSCYATANRASDSATLIVPVVDGQPGASQPATGGGFSAIACPSTDDCYAVGYAGGPASTNHGQGTGGFVAIVDGQPGPVQTVAGAGPLDYIACPASNVCLAFGQLHGPPIGEGSDALLAGAVVPITDGVAGSVISVDAGTYVVGQAQTSDFLGSADCSNSETCYVLTQDGIIAISVGGDGTLQYSACTGRYGCLRRRAAEHTI